MDGNREELPEDPHAGRRHVERYTNLDGTVTDFDLSTGEALDQRSKGLWTGEAELAGVEEDGTIVWRERSVDHDKDQDS